MFHKSHHSRTINLEELQIRQVCVRKGPADEVGHGRGHHRHCRQDDLREVAGSMIVAYEEDPLLGQDGMVDSHHRFACFHRMTRSRAINMSMEATANNSIPKVRTRFDIFMSPTSSGVR